MKHGLHSLGALVLLGGIVVAGSALAGDPLPTAPTVLKKKGVIQKKILGVVLLCKPGSWGSHVQLQKIVEIKNTTTKTMPTGHKIYWSAGDGDKGDTTLDKALPAGGKVNGYGIKPNLGYTCTASTSPF